LSRAVPIPTPVLKKVPIIRRIPVPVAPKEDNYSETYVQIGKPFDFTDGDSDHHDDGHSHHGKKNNDYETKYIVNDFIEKKYVRGDGQAVNYQQMNNNKKFNQQNYQRNR
jgi:hypothetical protein